MSLTSRSLTSKGHRCDWCGQIVLRGIKANEAYHAHLGETVRFQYRELEPGEFARETQKIFRSWSDRDTS